MNLLLPSLLLSLLLLVCNVKSQSFTYKAEARFTQYASGSVTVMNGHVMVDLDVSGVSVGNENVSIPADCFNGGVYWHIHTEWNHDDELDKQGTTDCGDAQTGGHWDPWFACSDVSDGADCKKNGGCIWGSSIVQVNGSYQCDEDLWDQYAFACEVGDFTGKYGRAGVSNNKISESSSHWLEIDGIDLVDSDASVVFHCNDGTRAFCAPINVTELESYGDYERQTGNDQANINFNDLTVNGVDFDGTKITLGEGWVNVEVPKDVAEECETWLFYIYDEWNHDSSDSRYDDMCNMTYTGGVWDPTHSCIDNSGSMYCDDGTRCPGSTATAVDYDCDNEENALYCAHGDITGRIKEIETNGNGYYSEYEDRISIQVQLLAGKSIVMQCTDTSSDIDYVCTPISSSDLSLSSSSSSSSSIDEMTAGGVFGILMVIILFIVIPIGYIKGRQTEDKTKNVALVNKTKGTVGATQSTEPFANNANNVQTVETPVPNSNPTAVVVASGEKTPQFGTPQNGPNNINTNYNNSGNNLGITNDRGIEVGEFSPSPSPAVRPESGPHDVPVPHTPQGYETAGRLPPPVPKKANNNDNSMGGNVTDIDLNDNLSDNDDINGQKEDTPDQPANDFEDEAGRLSIEELGDPKM